MSISIIWYDHYSEVEESYLQNSTEYVAFLKSPFIISIWEHINYYYHVMRPKIVPFEKIKC